MKIAAIVLVSVGTVGLIVTFVFMRRRLEELRKFREEMDE